MSSKASSTSLLGKISSAVKGKPKSSSSPLRVTGAASIMSSHSGNDDTDPLHVPNSSKHSVPESERETKDKTKKFRNPFNAGLKSNKKGDGSNGGGKEVPDDLQNQLNPEAPPEKKQKKRIRKKSKAYSVGAASSSMHSSMNSSMLIGEVPTEIEKKKRKKTKSKTYSMDATNSSVSSMQSSLQNSMHGSAPDLADLSRPKKKKKKVRMPPSETALDVSSETEQASANNLEVSIDEAKKNKKRKKKKPDEISDAGKTDKLEDAEAANFDQAEEVGGVQIFKKKERKKAPTMAHESTKAVPGSTAEDEIQEMKEATRSDDLQQDLGGTAAEETASAKVQSRSFSEKLEPDGEKTETARASVESAQTATATEEDEEGEKKHDQTPHNVEPDPPEEITLENEAEQSEVLIGDVLSLDDEKPNSETEIPPSDVGGVDDDEEEEKHDQTPHEDESDPSDDVTLETEENETVQSEVLNGETPSLEDEETNSATNIPLSDGEVEAEEDDSYVQGGPTVEEPEPDGEFGHPSTKSEEQEIGGDATIGAVADPADREVRNEVFDQATETLGQFFYGSEIESDDNDWETDAEEEEEEEDLSEVKHFPSVEERGNDYAQAIIPSELATTSEALGEEREHDHNIEDNNSSQVDVSSNIPLSATEEALRKQVEQLQQQLEQEKRKNRMLEVSVAFHEANSIEFDDQLGVYKGMVEDLQEDYDMLLGKYNAQVQEQSLLQRGLIGKLKGRALEYERTLHEKTDYIQVLEQRILVLEQSENGQIVPALQAENERLRKQISVQKQGLVRALRYTTVRY